MTEVLPEWSRPWTHPSSEGHDLTDDLDCCVGRRLKTETSWRGTERGLARRQATRSLAVEVETGVVRLCIYSEGSQQDWGQTIKCMRERGVKEDSKAPGTSGSQRLWKAMVLESPLIPVTSTDTTKLCEVSCEGSRCFAHMSSGIINKRSPDFQPKARVPSPYITGLFVFFLYFKAQCYHTQEKEKPWPGVFQKAGYSKGLINTGSAAAPSREAPLTKWKPDIAGPLYAGKFPRWAGVWFHEGYIQMEKQQWFNHPY